MSPDLDALLVELADDPGSYGSRETQMRVRSALERIRDLEQTCSAQRETIERLQAAKTADDNGPSRPFLARVMAMAASSVDAWGETAQERMVYEELGELQVALAQAGRGRAGASDVIEEAADVVLMAIEAANLVGADPANLAAAIMLKLKRAEERVASATRDGRSGDPRGGKQRSIVEQTLDGPDEGVG